MGEDWMAYLQACRSPGATTLRSSSSSIMET